MNTVEAPPEPERRARVRVWQIAMLGVALLAFAGALAFFLPARSEQADAAARRHRADSALAAARHTFNDTKREMALERIQAVQQAPLSGPLLQVLQNVNDLADQFASSDIAIEQLGATDQVYSDAFRAAAAHADQLGQQYDALIEALRRLDVNNEIFKSPPTPSTVV